MKDEEVLLRIRRKYEKDDVVRLLRVEVGMLTSEVQHLEEEVAKKDKYIASLERKIEHRPDTQLKKGIILPIHSQWYVQQLLKEKNTFIKKHLDSVNKVKDLTAQLISLHAELRKLKNNQ